MIARAHTIYVHERAPLFGRVVDGAMALNEYGEIVREEWFRSAEIRAEVELLPDELVVMPNHIHGIVWIVGTDVEAHGRAPLRKGTLARSPRFQRAFIARFKSAVTRRINALRGTPGAPVLQRNYYERTIRTCVGLNGRWPLHAIRRYIANNPLRWHLDPYKPAAVDPDPMART